MNFGKVADLTGIDLSLPPDAPRTARVLERALRSHGKPQKIKVFLGATGWSNREWQGTWYPAKAKPQDYLRHYSKLFNTIEFNTTHYRIPEPELVERWHDEAAEGFVFCPKIPQQISHRARLRAEEPTLRFAESMKGLGNRLGPCFIQLPDHHGPAEGNLIRGFLKQWPSALPLHWELRHPDWFSAEGGPAGEGWDALEAAGHGSVITDVAGRRDVLHMALTTPVLMLRFVGNGLHPSDYERTAAWVERIADWAGRGLQESYIFIHQPEINDVPGFTAHWARELNKALGLELHVPQPIIRDVQGTLF